jgi:hypothetical protein
MPNSQEQQDTLIALIIFCLIMWACAPVFQVWIHGHPLSDEIIFNDD